MPKLSNIVGHKTPLAILRGALSQGRTAPAYIFLGPSGVGRTTTALAFGSALNCATSPGEGCDECDSCRKIATGQHPDVLVRQSESGGSIGIEQARELSQIASTRPNEARFRVVILKPAEKLTANAANALLKTFEEPRPDTLFVLVTTAVNQLLPTVRSRCQLIRFTPLGEDDGLAVLAAHASAQAPADERALLKLADGSPGQAIRLLEAQPWESYSAELSECMTALRTAAESHSVAAISNAGYDRATTERLLRCLRRLVSEQLHADSRKAQQARGASGAGLEPRGAAWQCARALEDVERAATALERNATPSMVLERLVLDLSRWNSSSLLGKGHGTTQTG